ncbi:MAG: hypothetical protein M1817_005886 [Caeruleum heppii]|nr:MAG: hypothetical protein M1817_005886 [Caeruleum heppii]
MSDSTAMLESESARELRPREQLELNAEAPEHLAGRIDDTGTHSPLKRKRTPSGANSPVRDRYPSYDDPSHLEVREMPSQAAMSDARLAGVHSAAALFRRPSASSKKYTRPPMSKLFSSLELSPENFLHLQAAAKGYMLDENHPERRDCVGNRGKGDTDMVRLRLHHCVREFLEQDDRGLRFFGRDVEQDGIGDRRLIWPEEKQNIITAATPLLRRMVTNERQRQYAIVSRKSGGLGSTKKRKFDDNDNDNDDVDPTPAGGRSAITHDRRHESNLEDPNVNYDPALLDPPTPAQQGVDREVSLDPNIGRDVGNADHRTASPTPQHLHKRPKVSNLADAYRNAPCHTVESAPISQRDTIEAPHSDAPGPVVIQLNFLAPDNFTRRLSRIDIPLPSLASAFQTEDFCKAVETHLPHELAVREGGIERLHISALTAVGGFQAVRLGGKARYEDEVNWERVVDDVREVEWMDGVIKVLVRKRYPDAED